MAARTTILALFSLVTWLCVATGLLAGFGRVQLQKPQQQPSHSFHGSGLQMSSRGGGGWDDSALGTPLFEKGSGRKPKAEAVGDVEKSVLFVGNLPFSFSEADFAALAEAHDATNGLLKARITLDYKTQRSRGFGYLDYSSQEEAEVAATKLRGIEVSGRAIKVDLDAGADGPNRGRRLSAVSKDLSVFVGNLDFSLRERDVEDIFRRELGKDEARAREGEADEEEEAPEVGEGEEKPRKLEIRCRLMSQDGRSKGFGHVDFADAEDVQRALFLHGFEVMGRPLVVERAAGVRAATGREGGVGEGADMGGAAGAAKSLHSIFLGNLAFDVTADDIVDMCADLLGPGVVKRVRLATDRGTGQFKGFGHVDLGSADDEERALAALVDVELYGRMLKVDRASWGGEDKSGGSSRAGAGGGPPGRGAAGRWVPRGGGAKPRGRDRGDSPRRG